MENSTNVPTVNADQISESVREMNSRISKLAPSTPTKIHSPQEQRKVTSAKHNKPPHCKTCHHPMKGHSCCKSQTKCTMCQIPYVSAQLNHVHVHGTPKAMMATNKEPIQTRISWIPSHFQ